jgi:predicted AlkP superfamily pyrophosphatase or phosphodiesterase
MENKLILFIIICLIRSSFSSAQIVENDVPKLVVEIVVDQMRYDYIVRYWDKFGDEGFKKLINEGTLCKNAKYDYLLTSSPSGYATISTGTSPAMHGIISDKWYLRLKEKEMYCVYDEDEKLIGANVVENIGKSPRQLISSTWSDELKISNFKESKVIGISMNDYAAIIPGGYLSNAAYWFDNEDGKWVSSTYYMDSIPEWVREFNNKGIPEIYLSRIWLPLLDIEDYTESLHDGSSYELGYNGNSSFPYNLTLLKQQYASYEILKLTPFGNTYTKDFTISAIIEEELGKDEVTDFLSVGFSATGSISDLFGIRSIEIEDTYLRLDNDIAHLISTLNDMVGIENTLIYLTADRGSADDPAFLNDIDMQGSYFNTESALSVLNSYLKALYGWGEWIIYYDQNQIYLNQILIEDSKLSLPEVQEKAAQFMVQFSGIANSVSAITMMTAEFNDGIFEKAQNSFNQDRSGDIFISFSPGWIAKNQTKDGISLSSQISPYNYSTHVPIIWYGWKIPHKTIYRSIQIEDIAPTISLMLNISFPNASTGTPIEEILQ